MFKDLLNQFAQSTPSANELPLHKQALRRFILNNKIASTNIFTLRKILWILGLGTISTAIIFISFTHFVPAPPPANNQIILSYESYTPQIILPPPSLPQFPQPKVTLAEISERLKLPISIKIAFPKILNQIQIADRPRPLPEKLAVRKGDKEI
jgi:hypothetical protein